MTEPLKDRACKCTRCNHEWAMRDSTGDPKTCPGCNSPYWNKKPTARARKRKPGTVFCQVEVQVKNASTFMRHMRNNPNNILFDGGSYAESLADAIIECLIRAGRDGEIPGLKINGGRMSGTCLGQLKEYLRGQPRGTKPTAQ